MKCNIEASKFIADYFNDKLYKPEVNPHDQNRVMDIKLTFPLKRIKQKTQTKCVSVVFKMFDIRQ